jgi:hypothetical protein
MCWHFHSNELLVSPRGHMFLLLRARPLVEKGPKYTGRYIFTDGFGYQLIVLFLVAVL